MVGLGGIGSFVAAGDEGRNPVAAATCLIFTDIMQPQFFNRPKKIIGCMLKYLERLLLSSTSRSPTPSRSSQSVRTIPPLSSVQYGSIFRKDTYVIITKSLFC
jgi:hypothetical protein